MQPRSGQRAGHGAGSGEDGLVFYRAIAEHCQESSAPRRCAGAGDRLAAAEAVTALLAANGWADIACRKDFGGNDRCVMAET